MNPLYNTNDSPNNQTQPTKAVNRQGVYVPRTHNKFDNSYFHYKTQKFGQYEPFFVMDAVAGDKIPLHSSHNVRSLPMSSPFLSSLKLNKDYFMVPMQAILPNTWEYIFKLPTQGDDVPEDANCLFPLADFRDGAVSFLDYLFGTYISLLSDSSYGNAFRVLCTLELFCSQGSLLAQLGYHLNPIINMNDGTRFSFDSYFDYVCRNISSMSLSVTTADDEEVFFEYDASVQTNTSRLSQLISLVRTYGSRCVINGLDFANEVGYLSVDGLPKYVDGGFDVQINMSRLLAYQMCCFQYYVNPQVDFLYNAQLYRDNLFTLWSILMDEISYDSKAKFFTLNGIQVPYDYAAGAYFNDVFRILVEDDYVYVIDQAYDYLYALFGLRETLRFGDYFIDSRTRPLALGDNYTQVTTQGVDVIDMSKNIIYQRFRNAVVKLGNNFGDYLRGIYGTDPSPDYHFPKYIAHGEFDVNGFEVANTSDLKQGNMVTNLRAGDDTFSFEVTVDMPCVLLGISYFSVPRIYMQTKDRHFFHKDRYDMFNPMLQNIGDQIVYNVERTDLRPQNEIFGYQSRNNEYKQRLSIASGAFATLLPAWSFVTDSIFNPIDDIIPLNVQSPEFIRAHDYEFDRFFAAMPGYSLANGFHFIVVYNNMCPSVRPMEINPSTL